MENHALLYSAEAAKCQHISNQASYAPEPSGTDNSHNRHHLAPISGSIDQADASPLAAAWREIHEETTLTPSSLALFRQGKSYTFSDPSIRREWTIYPFAFRLKSGIQDAEKIKIDWEHEGWDWYDPSVVEDSDAFGGAPRLAESLRRVWFEKDLGEKAGKILSDGLDKLANDFTSGARQMADDALRILRDVIRALSVQESGEQAEWSWENIRFAAWHIWKNGRESMGAAIMNALLSALDTIEQTAIIENRGQNVSAHSRFVLTLSLLDSLIEKREREHTPLEVSETLQRYIKSEFVSTTDSDPSCLPSHLSILTLSESSTIECALHHLAKDPSITLDLRILESRPQFEGVSLAATLAKRMRRPPSTPPHTITLYTDASAVLAAQDVDLVIVGADRIASNGAVSNKTGTLPAILAARHTTSTSPQPARIVVLADSEKIAPAPNSPQDHVIENGDPAQVTHAWQESSSRIKAAAESLSSVDEYADGRAANINVCNISFEWCPPDLIDAYITEFAVWSVAGIASHSEYLGERERRLFGDL